MLFPFGLYVVEVKAVNFESWFNSEPSRLLTIFRSHFFEFVMDSGRFNAYERLVKCSKILKLYNLIKTNDTVFIFFDFSGREVEGSGLEEA